MLIRRKRNKNQGITLIALVITIIVLLILAGITVTALSGENGIIKKAVTAKEDTEKSNIIEMVKVDILKAEQNKRNGILEKSELTDILKKYFNTVPDDLTEDTILVAKDEYGKYEIPFGDLYNENVKEDSGGNEDDTTVVIPEGLEIGTAVSYTPRSTFKWDSKYYSYDSSKEPVTLDSSSSNFKIDNWRVLDINEENGEITLVPTAATKESVMLDGAQGYNNGVYLLNEACSNLYGNESKGISAKSIDISILEKYMTTKAIDEAHTYEEYGNQREDDYGSRNNSYPTMYAKEINSVIDSKKEETGLTFNSQTEPILVDALSPEGFLTATTSINPYQTYYYGDSSFMESAFKDVPNSTLNYYELLMPQDSDTYYWIASRCIQHHSGACEFGINYVRGRRIDMVDLFYSDEDPNYYSSNLFPVVTLNVKLISGDSSSGFSVNV